VYLNDDDDHDVDDNNVGWERTCGGPTLVTNQILGGTLATEGWLCPVRSGRVLLFNAKYLHGVLPGRGLPPNPTVPKRRLSFMVGFWRKLHARQRGAGIPGPGQELPAHDSPHSSWQRGTDMALIPGVSDRSVGKAKGERTGQRQREAMGRRVELKYVDAVWEKSNPHLPNTGVPSYEACFQGF